MASEIQKYKGKPVLVLKEDAMSTWSFTFGIAKAKLILENIQAIEDFVRSDGGRNIFGDTDTDDGI